MTGFGRAQRVTSQRKITVEVRSLNSKQLDLSTRVPSLYREHEVTIRSAAAKVIERGKSDITVTFQNLDNSASNCTINHDLFRSYYRELEGLLSEVGGDSCNEHLLACTLRIPEVTNSAVVEIDATEVAALNEAVAEALDNYDNFRKSEGEALMTDLMERITVIEKLSAQIPQYEGERIETVRARLLDNLAKLSVEIDQNRLEQELIYYLEKYDVTEEKVRLRRHLEYFREEATQPGAGRKLGFITQEIGREINTTGSKANHAEIQKLVVAMKDELEKIKEQLLNIL